MTTRSSELFARAATAHSRRRQFARARVSRSGREPFFVERAAGREHLGCRRERIHRLRRHLGPGDSRPRARRRVEAVREAAARGVSFGIPNPLEVEMAELICDWVPSIEKVRMVNSGTEATMSCVRLARGFTGRDKIIKFEGCYHGHVDSLLVKAGSGALTHGQPDSAGVPEAFAGLTISLPFNDIEAVRAAFRENPQARSPPSSSSRSRPMPASIFRSPVFSKACAKYAPSTARC